MKKAEAPRRRTTLVAIALIAVLTLVIYHGVVFRPGVIYGKDTVLQGYPLAWFEIGAVKQWSVPGWFPYMMSGFPIATGKPFYPIDWLSFFLPVSRVITWRYILHTFAAAAMMFLLLRRFGRSFTGATIGAIAFAFSAFFISKAHAGHLSAFLSGVWIPLTLLLLDMTIETRRPKYAALTGASLALQILGQHPQYVFYSILALLLYASWRVVPVLISERGVRSAPAYAGLAAMVALFAFLISAPHLLGFAELAALSSRGGGADYGFASSFSMNPAQLLTAAVPSFWGSPARSNSAFGALYWDAAMYIGLLPFLLAAAAVIAVRDSRASYFKVLAFVSILAALGGHTPVYRLIYHIPGFDMLRAPSKILYLYTFAAAALAAYGADLILTGAPKAVRKVQQVFTFCALPLIGASIVWLAAKGPILSLARAAVRTAREDPTRALAKVEALHALQLSSLACAAAFAAAGTAVIFALVRRRIGPRAALAGLAVLSFADLWLYADPLLYTVNARRFYTSTDRCAIAFVKADPGRFRILPLDTGAFRYAQGVFDELENVNGYYPVVLARYAAYLNAVGASAAGAGVTADVVRHDSPLVDLLNVRYVLSSKRVQSGSLVEVCSGRTHVYLNKGCLPRAFTVHSVRVVPRQEDALRQITRPDFDPTRTIVLETAHAPPNVAGDPSSDRIRFTSHTANELRLNAEMRSAGYVFLSEVFYPAWRAWVDGRPTDILPADYLFRAVYVPAGRHEVRMAFINTGHRIGAILSVAALAFIAGMLIIDRRRTPRLPGARDR